jgi:predicted transposase/invertase (TIGR01784 family)
MERTIISFDYAIKNILRDKANFDVLSGFLTELLGKKVIVQEILESESNIENPLEKTNRIDLKAKINDGEIAVFEIQFFDQIDFLGKVLFNACKAVVEQVSKGGRYDIKKVYSINIAYFELGAKKEYVFRANLSKFSGIHFDETLSFSQELNPPSDSGNLHPEYYLILPSKFDEHIRSKFDEWVYALKKSKVRSDFTAAGIQIASEKLDYLKMSDAEKKAYDHLQYDDMDYKSQLYTAELKGKMEGEAKGKLEGKLEIAKNLKNIGVPLNQISQATGLTPEEIEKL